VIQAHDSGITGISWGPPNDPCLLMAERGESKIQQNKQMTLANRRFVTAGMDRMVKIWRENPETQTYEQAGRLSLAAAAHGEAHKDWVRDVAWCNNVGIMTEMIATVGEDQAVRIWRSEPLNPK